MLAAELSGHAELGVAESVGVTDVAVSTASAPPATSFANAAINFRFWMTVMLQLAMSSWDTNSRSGIDVTPSSLKTPITLSTASALRPETASIEARNSLVVDAAEGSAAGATASLSASSAPASSLGELSWAWPWPCFRSISSARRRASTSPVLARTSAR